MNTLLVLGAGRSSSSLIRYLLNQAGVLGWQIIVGDTSLNAAIEKVKDHPNGKAIHFDINNSDSDVAFESADIVVSLLPASLHPLAAVRCLRHNKHLITASYVSDEMNGFHEEALSKGLLFLNECGLDPGIDHMSAMQVIDRIQSQGGSLISFESFTGGLIAQETDPENPWRYKFTWNPRNVVMAGQSTAKYLQNGVFKYIPYQQLFRRTTPISIPGVGEYEGYANRDSLKYIETYGLQNVSTMLRGTLRNKGFCEAWNILVQLGCCDDTYQMENISKMTHANFIDSFLDSSLGGDVANKLVAYFNLSPHSYALRCLEWSGFFSDELIGLEQGSAAQILEHILNKKWKLLPEDRDQVVMWHRFVFESAGEKKEIQSSLIATGSDSVYTAMAKTVGLPLGIAAKLLMQKQIKTRGVAIPVSQEFYDPILQELRAQGIILNEIEKPLS